MVLHLHIPFAEPLPSVELVAAQVALNTGLSMRYERMSLFCEPLRVDIGLYPTEEEAPAYYITLGPGNYKCDYLLYATLMTLVDLGGQYHEPLPAWAGQPWEVAKLIL